MNFSHCDHDEKYLTLHDCVAGRAYFENGKLGFEFDDGFWVSPDHPESNLSELVRTDHSKVEYILEYGIKYGTLNKIEDAQFGYDSYIIDNSWIITCWYGQGCAYNLERM